MERAGLTQLLAKYHLRPAKRLGQHFLVDEQVLQTIIAASNIKPGEPVLEIGAGPGILTKELAQAGAEVLAIEYDRDYCRLLQEEFHNWKNVSVKCDDALRLDFKTLPRKVVSNIPYQITNPLLRKIMDLSSSIDVAILLIQKEVANRLSAPPGSSERGILTVMVEMFGRIEKIAEVPPSAFWPEPKVNSTIVKLTRIRNEVLGITDDKAFFWFVKHGFAGKRKILLNSLSAGLQMSKKQTEELLQKAGIDPKLRAEDLSLADWQRLFKEFTVDK